MKAIIQDRYGSPDVLDFREIDPPVPRKGEVLIRVQAAALHPGDLFLMRGLPYVIRLGSGLRKPKKRVPGFDVAGRVEAVADGGSALQPGDEVFGQCNGSCAELAAASEDQLALKPANLTFEQAASLTVSGVTALQVLRDTAKVQPGQKVLIIGASGGVGTFAVQIAKTFGAEVTGVCSTRNADRVRALGADHVIDYTREDLTESGERFDFILDNAASHSLSELRRMLTPKGMLTPNNGTSGGRWIGAIGRTLAAVALTPFVSQKLRPFFSVPRTPDLEALKALLASGKVVPVIDRTYPLAEVPEAMRYLEEGHARGKVVITL